METFTRAFNICKQMLDTGKAKDKAQVKVHASEVIFLMYSIIEIPSDPDQLAIHEQFLRDNLGERSTQLAHFMFLKAKKLMANKEINAAEALVYVDEAISIEDEIQKDKPVKTA